MAVSAKTISVLIAIPGTPIRDSLWSDAARQTADRLGFRADLMPETDFSNPAEWARCLGGYRALVTGWDTPRLDGAMLQHAEGLEVVGHAGGSVARIVSPELFERGIRVVTANRLMADAVAEWCLMMTLVALRRLPTYAQWGDVTKLRWSQRLAVQPLHHSTIGIWGYGAVARRLIEMLQMLGVRRILVHTSHPLTTDIDDDRVEMVSFEQLFQDSDVLHTLESLTPTTEGMLTHQQLASMRPGATLINAGRGALIDEHALIDILRQKRIQAILDVFHTQPLPTNHPLRTMPNVILTPHNAGTGYNDLYISAILEDFDRAFRGKPLKHEITMVRAGTMTQE